MGLGFQVDKTMIDILVRCYNKDDGSFIFNENRCYFNLVDVQIITGLRVDGKPVLGRMTYLQRLFKCNLMVKSLRKGK